MKMNKHPIIGTFFLALVIILSAAALAQTAEMKDTKIDYVSYREIVVNDAGVVYPIKIANTADKTRTYEITPDAAAIRSLGTYRLDPSDRIDVAPGEEQTVYLYLAVEKAQTGRVVIPVTISSGLGETTIELVARPIGPFVQQKQASNTAMVSALKVVLVILLAIVILIALVLAFRKMAGKKKGGDGEEEYDENVEENIETYY